MQFPAERSLPLSDVNEILDVGVFHYADRKHNFKKLNFNKITTFWNMHEVDQDVVVMYTVVKKNKFCFESYKGL